MSSETASNLQLASCEEPSMDLTPRAKARPDEPPWWFRLLLSPRLRCVVLLWWIAWLCAGGYYLRPYFGLVGWDAVVTLPDDLPGKVAMKRLYKYFPAASTFCSMGYVRLSCDRGSQDCPASTDEAGSEELMNEFADVTKRSGDTNTFDSQHVSLVGGSLAMQPSPNQYILPGGRAELFTACSHYMGFTLALQLNEVIKGIDLRSRHLEVGLTSRYLLANSTIESVKRDLPIIDSVCVLAAFLILGCLLRSGKLLIVALLNLVIAFLTTFAVLYIICKRYELVPDPTQVNFVTIISIGLNFDYSLFLLTRFLASSRNRTGDWSSSGADVENAVFEMLQSVCSVILSSGTTLTVVFCSFLFLSSGNLVMAGLGCAVTTVVVMAVSLTMVPAVLLTFPHFFHQLAPKESFTSMRMFASDKDEFVHNPIAEWHSLTSAEANALRTSNQARVWRLITTWPYNLVVVLMLNTIAIGIGLPVLHLRLNNDISEIAPRSDSSYQTLQLLNQYSQIQPQARDFIGFVGQGDAFFILIEAFPTEEFGSNPKQRLRECGYDLTAELARRLLAIPEDEVGFSLRPAAIFGPGWARGKVINRKQAMAWQGDGVFSEDEEDIMVTYFADTMRTCIGECFAQPSALLGEAATLMSVVLPVNPASADGDRFITKTRELLERTQDNQTGLCDGVHLHLHLADAQATVVNHDLMRRTFGEFKRNLPVTMILIFLMIGVFLKSAFAPLRLALTLVLPLCAVFGLAVLVFQEGCLSWMGIPNVAASPDRSFHWEVPIFSFALTIALALDYDLFVVIRVADFRFAGYSIQASIVRALHETAPVVTSAGLIMAFSFGGNLLAESTTLNQAGWLLATGVLIDTFVVRTLLVPALLSLADNVSWWPSQPQKEKLMNEYGQVEELREAGTLWR